MKKAIILCEILVVIFIALKIFSIFFLNKMDGSGLPPWFLGTAIAEPSIRALQSGSGDVDDRLAHERKLLASLMERQQQLDGREALLRSEEKRLEALKKEIVQKIESLRELEEKLTTPLEEKKASEEKRFKDLAKIYEAAPPRQVGTILEKMDNKTAAGILMHMNSKKAGAVWGFLSPERSVEIAGEITKAGSVVPHQ